MPRFVVLEHDHPEVHWDFLLEWGETLRSWRLAAPPSPGHQIAATPLPPHRRLYLDYEGPVSGGRGTVSRWDGGDYELEQEVPELALILHGRRLQVRAVLKTGPGDSCLWAFSNLAEHEC